MRVWRALGFVAALALAAPALAADAPTYRALQTLDARLAAIGDRLATANVALCRETQPAPGWQLHAIDQYPAADRAALTAVFAFPAALAVEVVIPGGAAEKAGIRAGDGVVAIAGTPVTPPAGTATTSATRDAAQALVAAQPAAAPLAVTIQREGVPSTVTILPRPACRAAFEILPGKRLTASTDGRVIQIGSAFFERFDDATVAIAVAHELAHVVLRHPARLEAARVNRGLGAQFGKSARLFRRTEAEADLLGAVILRNAGYDPASAVRFWQVEGGRIYPGGLLRSRDHPSSKERAAAVAVYLAQLPPDAPLPYVPPLVAERDTPLE